MCLFNSGIRGQVDEHEAIGNHAEDKPKDDDGVPAPLYSEVTHEAKQDASDHFCSSHNDATDGRQGLGREIIRAEPEGYQASTRTYSMVNPMQVV